MAYEIPGFSFTLPSGTDFRTGAGQYRFVKNSGSSTAVVSGVGGRALGVRQTTPNAGEEMTIVNGGISLVEAGDVIVSGAFIASDSVGRAVTADTGDYVLGEAMEAASAAGVLFAVLLHHSSAVGPA